jgi:Restriction endonuclease
MTPRVGDQGVDIIANKGGDTIAIQCKRYSDKAPNSAVSAVHSGSVYYGCHRAMLVCLGGFSRAAVELADSTAVELIGGKEYADLVHRVAPSAAGPSIWLPRGRTLATTSLLFILGVAAIVFDQTHRANRYSFSAAPASAFHGSSLIVIIGLGLVVVGLLSLNKKRRRHR